MKYLGVDFGSKRIGLALSDESESFAMPLKVIENSGDIVLEISKICKEKKVDAVIVGESLNFEMKENEIMKEIIPFVERLKIESKLPVILHPEFLTSLEAKQLQGKNHMLDASAAALILKSYLDKIKNNGK